MIVLRLSQLIDEISLVCSRGEMRGSFGAKCFHLSLSGQPYFKRLSVCNPSGYLIQVALCACPNSSPTRTAKLRDPETSYLVLQYSRTPASQACRHILSNDLLLREASSFHPMETPMHVQGGGMRSGNWICGVTQRNSLFYPSQFSFSN